MLVDNQAALGCARKGTSSASDLAALAHAIWQLAVRCRMDLRIYWVPSKLNLADLPSRGGSPESGRRVTPGPVAHASLARAVALGA